jgi:membrane protease YdiL (CAAX protease family)
VDTGSPAFEQTLELAAKRERPRPVHLLAWLLFFTLWVVLAVFPFVGSLSRGEEYIVPPGMLNDPAVVVIAIAGSWFSFLIAALLAWRARLTLNDVGFRLFAHQRLLWWSAGTLAGLLTVWVLVSAFFGDKLEIVEPLTRRPSGLYHWLLWMLLALSAGFCEEFVVRGYGTGFLIRWGVNRWGAAVITSAIFGLLHIYQGSGAVLVIALWGFLFAIPYVKTGSLIPGIFAHTAVDAIAPLFL